MQSVLQCNCNIHSIRKTFFTSENLKKHEMHFSTDALPNVRMLQNIFIRLQQRHHITFVNRRTCFHGFQFVGRSSLHWFSFSNAAATMRPFGRICVRTSLCVQKLVESQSNKMRICCWCHYIQRKTTCFHDQNLHLDHIKICIWITQILYQ